MVEWKKLGEIGIFENIGTDKKIIQGEKLVTLLNYVDVYHHKFIDSSVPQMVVSASDKKCVSCTVEKGDIFVTPTSETVDDIGHSSVITETIPNTVYSYHIMRYRLYDKNMLLSYYINYAFETDIVKKQILKKAQGLTRFGLSKDKFGSIQIPIPPLSEQNRIVGILDTFSESIENIKTQITQRRKQYEYYRDKLLDLEGKPEGNRKLFGDICEMIKGNGVQKTDFVEEGIGCIHYGQIYTHYGSFTYTTNKFVSKDVFNKAKKASKGDIVMTDTSENVEDICKSVAYLGEDDIAVSNHALIIKHNQNPKFLTFTTQTKSFFNQKRKYAYGVKVTGIKPEHLARFLIYLPSIEEQNRIVSILEQFEASISNLEAQLSLRQKQYEYYRNKLLTFS